MSTCLAPSAPRSLAWVQVLDLGAAVGSRSSSPEFGVVGARTPYPGMCTQAWPPENSTWARCSKGAWAGSKGWFSVGHSSSSVLEVLGERDYSQRRAVCFPFPQSIHLQRGDSDQGWEQDRTPRRGGARPVRALSPRGRWGGGQLLRQNCHCLPASDKPLAQTGF